MLVVVDVVSSTDPAFAAVAAVAATTAVVVSAVDVIGEKEKQNLKINPL